MEELIIITKSNKKECTYHLPLTLLVSAASFPDSSNEGFFCKLEWKRSQTMQSEARYNKPRPCKFAPTT